MSIPLASYPRYSPLDPSEMRIKYTELGMMLNQGLKVLGINPSDITVDNVKLMEAIERVEKRRVYFWTYYGIEMSEKNEASLYCFWLLKLAPIFDTKNPGNDVNVKLALHLLLKSVTYTAGKTGSRISVKSDYLHHLAYAFRYRDLSKESIMSITESLLA